MAEWFLFNQQISILEMDNLANEFWKRFSGKSGQLSVLTLFFNIAVL